MPAEITLAFRWLVNFMLNPFALFKRLDDKTFSALIQGDYLFSKCEKLASVYQRHQAAGNQRLKAF
ncbi:MAG TPA: hypothetical protein VLA40_08080 [Rheinheimera sp.]|nr:hypothetical protein [Rheinheimera sp.]